MDHYRECCGWSETPSGQAYLHDLQVGDAKPGFWYRYMDGVRCGTASKARRRGFGCEPQLGMLVVRIRSFKGVYDLEQDAEAWFIEKDDLVASFFSHR
jgi:hypothetical protein